MTAQATGAICGPSTPLVGSVVPMSRLLHDNGFGFCGVLVRGLYGKDEQTLFCTFQAFTPNAWTPLSLQPRSLRWLEKRIATWDSTWPNAQWSISLAWPGQSEEWTREQPGQWVVTKVGSGIV